jgi:predicted DNA-binding transcriptional regulator AlpA
MKPEQLRQITQAPPRYARMGALCAYLGVSTATGWRRVHDDPTFPQPIKVSAGVTVFDLRDADIYIASKRAAPLSVREGERPNAARSIKSLRRCAL